MKSAPQWPIFLIGKHKTEIYEIDFAIRIDSVYRIYFHLYSISTVIWNGRYKRSGLRVPTSVKPAFDYWMRDTWATLGPDGYYYITGTTSTPDRYFPGQRHCWDWIDGLYLWRSKDMKSWEARGQIWSMEKDGTWQKKPKVYKAGRISEKIHKR